MKSFASWLIIMFAALYWILRVVVLFTNSMGIDFIIQPINAQTEMILLFITIICIVLIGKRKIAGGIIYLLTHLVYFGMDAFLRFSIMITGLGNTENVLACVVSIIGILLPFSAFVDLLLDKTRKTSGGDKKTDWFYKNKDFDRDLDERADKNHYKL